MIVDRRVLETEYKVFIERTIFYEFEIEEDGNGDPVAGKLYDEYEPDQKYLVKEVVKGSDGEYVEIDNLEVFETYKEALDFIEELKNRE